jgi:threonine dehydratase
MISIKDINEANNRISGRVRVTPTVRFSPLRDSVPYEIWLKLENLQITGSFKARGAINKILSLPPDQIRNGIVTASGGNHGLGVAYAAHLLGVPATVYVPEKANQGRRDRLKRWNATVIPEGRDWDDSYAAAMKESKQTGRPIIHAFNDEYVIAGQGTAALEMLSSCPPLDAVVVPIGGGGLISGIATYVKETSPATVVIGVEPVGAASMSASLQAGKLVELPNIQSIADTLSSRSVGDLTLETTAKYVDRVVLIEDDMMRNAMRRLWNEFNLLVEPSGAAALAALLEDRTEIRQGSRVGVIVSGGNIDAGPAMVI